MLVHHNPAHLRQRNTQWIFIYAESSQDLFFFIPDLYLTLELLHFSCLLCITADLLVESVDLLSWDPVEQLLQQVWAVRWRIRWVCVSRRAKEPANQQAQGEQAQPCRRVPAWRWVTGDDSVYRGQQQPFVPRRSRKAKSRLPLSTPPAEDPWLSQTGLPAC